ncbi:MAG: ATP-dependent helicase HrpB [Verrucomicrobiales bacterium]|nr:ATP-dependent helicase HrpB [Verrucomicrobiales bacterium]
MALPIYEVESQLVTELRAWNRVVLTAPTGSGKSTQVPPMLLRHGLLGAGQVIVLQPRRLATRLLAKRVAEELDVPLGQEVGYQIRFENVAGPKTRIRFVTEGILLRQMLQDPKLNGTTALVFDEFHERHLYSDITLARALDLQETHRPDLRLIVMSATLDVRLLAEYLRPCGTLSSHGRTFPVEIEFADRPSYNDSRPIWDQAAEAFASRARRGDTGDVLIFMPGAHEIHRTLEALSHLPEARGRVLLPLHGELPPRDQDAAVARQERPKIVVATNVAETSVTIDGVRLVIDSGLARIPRHDPWRGINTLLVEKISRAAADQRAGRAGRTAPGTCLRLWTADEHLSRAPQELPEVRRLDLAEVVLTLKSAGVDDLQRFRWLERPDDQALAHAETLLRDLGALAVPAASPEGTPSQITDLGRRMLSFPVHPRYARLLIAADTHGCVYHAAVIAALTQGRDLFLRKVDRETVRAREDRLGDRSNSDFFQAMRAWEYAAENDFRLEACQRVGIHAGTARQVAPLLRTFLDLARSAGLDIARRELDEDRIRRCVLLAFSDQVAHRLDAGTLRCALVHGRRGVLARESAVQDSPLLVAAEVREVGDRSGSVQTILSMATAVEPGWLRELFPDDIRSEIKVRYDTTTKRVVAEESLMFRDLPLETRRVEPPPADAAAQLLADEVIAGRLTLTQWTHAVEQWILRLNSLARWCPDLELPPIGDAERRDIITELCHGAAGYKDIKERPVDAAVRGWLSPHQQSLIDTHAPERLELSNGRKPKVTYTSDGPPYIALRIQELYEVQRTPVIAMGRVSVTVHILAPSMRPVQVTQDLANFWREHYPRVKSELQRKYPKHEWR